MSIPLTEYEIQKAIISWVRRHPDDRLKLLYACPNESRRSPSHFAKRRAEGMLAGVPDLHLPCPSQGYPGLFIEVKTPEGKLSKEQREYKERCDKVGYPYVIVRSVNQGIRTLETYLCL